MNKNRKKIPENDKNKNTNTSPTDIKVKDVHETNQTNFGAGGSQIKEGCTLLPEDAHKVPNQNSIEEIEIRKDSSKK